MTTKTTKAKKPSYRQLTIENNSLHDKILELGDSLKYSQESNNAYESRRATLIKDYNCLVIKADKFSQKIDTLQDENTHLRSERGQLVTALVELKNVGQNLYDLKEKGAKIIDSALAQVFTTIHS
jgi:chromosome segregation ATPase